MSDDTARPIRIAMIATGRIAGNALAPAIERAAGAELWSVLSRDAGRARDFAERHRAASPEPAYTDLDALLADPDLDAVLIASADGLHAGQCIAAASAGKHVLCEKPMATTAADAERMTAACRAAGVRLGIAYHMRWHRGHRDLADAAHAGRFGVLRHMRAQWSMRARDDSNWRARSEVGRWWGLAAVGTHCLDQVRWYMSPLPSETALVGSDSIGLMEGSRMPNVHLTGPMGAMSGIGSNPMALRSTSRPDAFNLSMQHCRATLRILIEFNFPTSSWAQLMVPVAVKLASMERQCIHLCVRRRHPGWVSFLVEFGSDPKPRSSSRIAQPGRAGTKRRLAEKSSSFCRRLHG